MASFIKNLFEKRKDAKYGKGYKLGDSTQNRQNIPTSQGHQSGATSSRVVSAAPKSEAALMAGQAALQRLENKNNPPSHNASKISRELKEAQERNLELEKGLALKDHYFGQKKQVLVDDIPVVSKKNIFYRASIFEPGERYPLEQVEDKIEQFLINQLEEEPILISVTLLFTANYKNQEKLNKCLEIMNKFIDNILNSPNEEKYRKIRLENPTFKEKVYSCKFSDLALKKGGFKPTTLKTTTTDSDGNEKTTEEDYFIFEGDEFESLQNLKQALSLGEPIIPELDRDIKIFRVTEQSSAITINNFDITDEFYNLNIDEIKREQKLRNEAVEKAGMLRTKAMRERDEQLELRRYRFCLIRVRFPNNFIIQALFKTNEPYEELYKLIDGCLEVDSVPFELFGHSLKKSISNELTLAELGLAPAAVLNFKWSDTLDESFKHDLRNSNYLKMDLINKASLM